MTMCKQDLRSLTVVSSAPLAGDMTGHFIGHGCAPTTGCAAGGNELAVGSLWIP